MRAAGALVGTLLAGLGSLGAANAQEPLRLACGTEDGSGFDLLLWEPAASGPAVHCVLGFPGLGELCAPDGGWGLYQDGERVATTLDPDATHDGLWVFARAGPSELVMSASRGTRPPLALEVAGDTFWRLRMSVAEQGGSTFTRDGEVPFLCAEP